METPEDSLASETEQRLALILARFPGRFEAAQIEQIRKRVDRSIRLGQSVRRVELSNGNGPDLIVATLHPQAGAE
jgi:hypothetical protein